jgi:ABC-2 type transport system permease protein
VVRLGIFQPGEALAEAGSQLPLPNQAFAANLTKWGAAANAQSDFGGGLAALGVFVALSSVVFIRKLRPE